MLYFFWTKSWSYLKVYHIRLNDLLYFFCINKANHDVTQRNKRKSSFIHDYCLLLAEGGWIMTQGLEIPFFDIPLTLVRMLAPLISYSSAFDPNITDISVDTVSTGCAEDNSWQGNAAGGDKTSRKTPGWPLPSLNDSVSQCLFSTYLPSTPDITWSAPPPGTFRLLWKTHNDTGCLSALGANILICFAWNSWFSTCLKLVVKSFEVIIISTIHYTFNCSMVRLKIVKQASSIMFPNIRKIKFKYRSIQTTILMRLAQISKRCCIACNIKYTVM